jgi:hypothetical protein
MESEYLISFIYFLDEEVQFASLSRLGFSGDY